LLSVRMTALAMLLKRAEKRISIRTELLQN
jgi:hypothetical protein